MAGLRAGLVMRRPSPAATVEAIARAEQQGLPMVWSTSGGTAADATTTFAAAAARTSRIGFGTAIVPTYPRHPIVLSAQALVVEALAPGRFRLGIGSSHRSTMAGVFGLSFERPLEHLREYLTVLRALLWQGAVDFQGEFFRVQAQLPPNVRPPRTPLPISALGKRAFWLAGEIADGAISWVCPVPYLIGTAKPALEAGARAAGRPTPPLIGHVPVAMVEDREAVRAAARQQLGHYGRQPFYARMFEEAGFPVGPDGSPSDALLDELVVAGPPDQVTARLQEIQAAGVDELVITHVSVTDAEAEETALIQLLAEASAGT